MLTALDRLMSRAAAWAALGLGVFLLFSSIAGGAPLTSGPISPYYLSDPNNRTIWVVQGGSVIRSFPWATSGPTSNSMIAVSTHVEARDTYSDPFIGSPGAQYTLEGVPTGNANANPSPAGIIGEYIYDGTSDGRVNYYAQWLGKDADGLYTQNVYRTDLDWQNPSFLFQLQPPQQTFLGYGSIAFDRRSHSLWISDVNNVYQYSMDGRLLFSFSVPAQGTMVPGIAALAYDPADDTLWGIRYLSNELLQYSKFGVLLQTVAPNGLPSSNIHSGDIAPIPEPTVASLLAIGLLVMLLLRKRRESRIALPNNRVAGV